MAIPRDPKFDIRLVDTADGNTILEELPLILTERGKALDFSATLTSPLVAQIGDGSPQDKDLSRYFVKSQRDWSAGRGKDFTYEETDRFSDATADTRFPGIVMLPPKTTSVGINTATYEPSHVGAHANAGDAYQAYSNQASALPQVDSRVYARWDGSGRTTTNTLRAKAEWVGTGRVNSAAINSAASWSNAGRSNGKKSAKASWSNAARSTTYQISNTQSVALENPLSGGSELACYADAWADIRNQAQSFVPDFNITASSLQLLLRSPINPGNGAIQIQLQSDNGAGLPSGTVLASYSMTSADHTSIGASFTWFSCSISASLTAGVRYWIVLWGGTTGTPARDTRWSTSQAYGSGTAASQLGAGGWFAVGADLCFKVNNSSPYYHARQRIAQKFITVGAVTLSQIMLYLAVSAWTAGASGTWRIETDSGGAPSGSAAASGTIPTAPSAGWNIYAASGTLTATTNYWMVLEMPTFGTPQTASLSWYGDSNQAYGHAAKISLWNSGTGAWQAWSNLSISLYFQVNTGFSANAPFFIEYAPSFQALQQNFTPQAAVTVTQVQLYLERLTWSGTPTVTLEILNGATVVATTNITDPTTTAGWKVYALSASLSAGTQYTIRLSASVSNVAHSVDVAWWCDLNSGFAGGTYELRTMGDMGWSAWSGAGADGYFQINTGYSSSTPYFYPTALTRYAHLQSFTTSAGGTVAQVKLFLQGVTWTGSPTAQIQLRDGTNTVIATATISSNPGTAGWKTYNMSATLAAASAYSLTLMVDAPTTNDAATIIWYCDTAQGYAGGSASQWLYVDGTGFGTPTPVSVDLYFGMLNASGVPISYFYEVAMKQTRVGMRFQNGGSSLPVTAIGALLERISWTGTPTATLGIYSDSSGDVGTLIAAATITPVGTAWNSAAVSTTLTASAFYWIVLSVVAYNTAHSAEIAWHGDSNQNYASGYARTSTRMGVDSFDSWSAGASATVDAYFNVNGGYNFGVQGPYFYATKLIKKRMRQDFVANATTTITRVDTFIAKVTWQTGITLRMYLYQVVAGVPSGAALANINKGDPGLLDWDATTTSVAITNGNTYCWMLEMDAPAEGVNGEIQVMGTSSALGGNPSCDATTYTESGGWAAWADVASTYLFFGLNNFSQTLPWAYTHNFAYYTSFQAFKAGANPLSVYQIRLYGKIPTTQNWTTGAYVEVLLCAMSGANPGTVLATGIMTEAMVDAGGARNAFHWVTVPMTASLSANTVYCILVRPYVTGPDSMVWWYWDTASPDTVVGTGSGYSQTSTNNRYTNTPSWTAGWGNQIWTVFAINNGAPDLSSPTIAPVRHGNNWFAAMGTGVYQFNTGTGKFDLVNSAGATVTALASYGGSIYAALGDGADVISSTTGASGTWAATTGQRGTYLLAYGFYLYLLKATNGATALAYYNGTTWVSQTFPTASVSFTGLVGFRDQVVIFTTRGAYELSSLLVNQILDYSYEEHADNGRNAVTWLRDNTLVIPIRFRLTQSDGAKSQPIGLDLDSGLPATYAGRIAMMIPTAYWLFAAVDAGASGISGVYAYNGKGWHRLIEGSAPGARIRSIGFEAVTNSNGNGRLWYWENSTPYYIDIPQLTDNPYAYTGATFAPSGMLTGARMGGELSQVTKDFQAISVFSSGCSASQPVDLFLEVNNSGLWSNVGQVTQSPVQEIELSQPNFGVKTCVAGCTTTTIKISATSTTADLQVGHFVRIGNEVGQVSSITGTRSFTLILPLSAAPAVGAQIFPSRPAGMEVRYRLQLSTDDSTKSPRVTRVSLRWMPQLLEKLRFTFSVKLSNDGETRTQGRIAATAAEIRAALLNWARRVTPSTLVTPMGDNYRVKITSLAEREFVREEVVSNALPRIGSVITITADEV